MSDTSRRATAEPITAVIAERVRDLRDRAGMNQAELAEAMTSRGVPWKRATVVNLEKRAPSSRGAGSGGRDSVSVQELLTLALVLNVPAVTLLADPHHADDVPVSPNHVLDVWDALGMITGAKRLDMTQPEPASFGLAAWAITQLLRFTQALDALARAPMVLTADGQDLEDPAEVREAVIQRERAALEALRDVVGRFRGSDIPMPTIPEHALKRAEDLGVDLGIRSWAGD